MCLVLYSRPIAVTKNNLVLPYPTCQSLYLYRGIPIEKLLAYHAVLVFKLWLSG